ncbi:CcdC family protein [Halalkalibacterium halodurans]|uniref:BH2333 protein n=2 Tax=Halalkalibacterium halodurans TaxID=86665 RepID=Q9KAF4_HALH5|nr:CcdC family protein [Halalkalibacterium halodurans]MDY7222884.1 CcdC family protein [Halalkalibacterium halodurans]MDY7242105.1 CcdC family protein [Halalkalibacterium halodurans]MED3648104.1 CcdC family protein [Halalkalibacterium halodurans]MED4080884.1 CcdC family protein [Halalkalibacterium halodurans]MED4085067.1 CcdC family protein [Halalkalibacterium halodurans]
MNDTYVLLSTIGAIFMATMVLIIRLKASKRPATVKKIILPPFFMSTGFFMFVYPPFRPSSWQVLEALCVGMIFSLFLIKTSKFEIRGDHIYLKRSKAFVFILIGLLILRIAFKLIIGDSIQFEELAGMFFLLAYGMIIPWRVAMYVSYKKLEKQMRKENRNKAIIPAET